MTAIKVLFLLQNARPGLLLKLVFNGNNNVFTASAVQLDPSKTKGVTIKNTPAAIGSYTATIYFPSGSSTAIATAAFTIYQGGDGKLAVSVP